MTGEKLFVRFLCPCAESMRQQGVINEQTYVEIIGFAHTDREPSRDALVRFSQKTVTAYDRFVAGDSRVAWSYESVLAFWLMHRGLTPVKHCRVTEIAKSGTGGAVRVACEDEELVAINYYNLPVSIGSEVVVHNHCIIIFA